MAKKNPTVSIVTITQLKRFPCLEILKDIIKAQTYKNIIEWVIVEGSPDEDMCKENSKNVLSMKDSCDIPIIYIEKIQGEKLGGLRNKGNKACSGEITVVMDDDDYYPVDRVKHAVDKLQASPFLLAGCSDMFIYDYILEKFCKFKRFGEYHSVNSCLAWKKKYLENHSHDETKESGEEPSFTKDFKEPMIQLDADKTVIQSSHLQNTFNKRELLTSAILKIQDTAKEVDEHITNYIKEPFFSRMKAIFYKQEKSKYDIVYFAGGFSMKWDPKSPALTGSEQGVVQLSSAWSKLGKNVAVYGLVNEGTFEGVDYFDWKKFPFHQVHDTVILWRVYGLICGAPFPIKARNIWLDLHDATVIKEFIEAWYRYGSKVTKLFFKSKHHIDLLETTLRKKLDPSRCVIIPNGLRIQEFSENKEMVQRNPYRFCYCSCYTRGLAILLQYVWPIIKRIEPRAELHVYYGLDSIVDTGFKATIKTLLSTPGVMDHGRQPIDVIRREKYMSSFHLYVTSSLEVDCISIRESLITGTIPLLSNHSIFKERDGVHYNYEENSMGYGTLALSILETMRDPNLDALRNKLKESKSITSWADVANEWLLHN